MRAHARHTNQPIVDDDEAHAEEITGHYVMKLLSTRLATLSFDLPVVRGHKVGHRGDMIRL